MAYWRLYYHIVWATTNRLPLITPRIESRLYELISARCLHESGHIYAVNGMADHVHVVVSIPPTILVASFIQRIKGSSSHFVNVEFGTPFKWQTGYGIFSVGPRGLRTVSEYVNRQKEHHAAGTLIHALENTTNQEDGPMAHPGAG